MVATILTFIALHRERYDLVPLLLIGVLVEAYHEGFFIGQLLIGG